MNHIEPKYQYMINKKGIFAPDLLFDNDLELDFALIFVTNKNCIWPISLGMI